MCYMYYCIKKNHFNGISKNIKVEIKREVVMNSLKAHKEFEKHSKSSFYKSCDPLRLQVGKFSR